MAQRRQAGLGWWRSRDIKALEESIQRASDILERHGPFIGTKGFSSGAAVAAIVIYLLEKKVSICNFNLTVSTPGYSPLFVSDLWFPISRSPPDRVCYLPSSFQLAHPAYAPIYYPKIRTNTPCHRIFRCSSWSIPVLVVSKGLR